MKNTTNKLSSFSSEKFFSNDCFCNKKELSLYINEIMRNKNLISSDIYKRADISKQTWSHIYSGQNCPSPENARRLLIGLKCDLMESEKFLSYCGMSFVTGSIYDDCLIYCLENHYDNMVDVSIYINQQLSSAA